MICQYDLSWMIRDGSMTKPCLPRVAAQPQMTLSFFKPYLSPRWRYCDVMTQLDKTPQWAREDHLRHGNRDNGSDSRGWMVNFVVTSVLLNMDFLVLDAQNIFVANWSQLHYCAECWHVGIMSHSLYSITVYVCLQSWVCLPRRAFPSGLSLVPSLERWWTPRRSSRTRTLCSR